MQANDKATAADAGPVDLMLGLVERLRQRGYDLRSHPVANGTIDRTEAAGELLIEAAAEIERLHKLLQEPTRGCVFAGWFSELRSGMAYRLWEQGGYEPEPGEVPLYV